MADGPVTTTTRAPSVAAATSVTTSAFLPGVADNLEGELLGSHLLADVGAAVAASALVAPFVSVIDKAIIQNQAGAAPLEVSIVQSFKAALAKPWQFVKRPEVLMVWGVYGFTYMSANVVNTTAKAFKYQPDVPRLVATTAANMGAGIAKDRAYARMFGTITPRALPTMSYFFFFSRDLVTMGASFNIPEPLSEELVATLGMPKHTADIAAQLFCPVAMQFITTPMHLMGLDLYNRPAQTWADRVALIRANYQKTVAARIARILPAFGFGGIGNKRFRQEAHAYVRRQHDQRQREPVVVLGRDRHADPAAAAGVLLPGQRPPALPLPMPLPPLGVPPLVVPGLVAARVS